MEMFAEAGWWYCALALLAGCVVQTAVGFGMALIAAPIIVMIKPEWVPYVLSMTALILSIKNAVNQRADIQWRVLMPALITRIPGTMVGTWVLLSISLMWLQFIVAVTVLLAIFVTARMKPFASTPVNMGIAGFCSGITGTTTSIGGPPMALVMQHNEGRHTRANLSVYFLYSSALSLMFYSGSGLMNEPLWLASLSMLPVAIAGFAIGKGLQKRVDKRFRPILLLICTASACVAIANVLLML